MKNVLLVAAGGALGSVLRYAVQKGLNLSFPYGTLAANVLGCFAAGWLMAALVRGLSAPLFLFLMTGVCGGFTTFSAFSAESVQMMLAGRKTEFFLYTLGSVVAGLAACFAGYKFFGT